MDQAREIPAALAWFENATASVRTEVRDGEAWHVVTIDSEAFEGASVVLDWPAMAPAAPARGASAAGGLFQCKGRWTSRPFNADS